MEEACIFNATLRMANMMVAKGEECSVIPTTTATATALQLGNWVAHIFVLCWMSYYVTVIFQAMQKCCKWIKVFSRDRFLKALNEYSDFCRENRLQRLRFSEMCVAHSSFFRRTIFDPLTKKANWCTETR